MHLSKRLKIAIVLYISVLIIGATIVNLYKQDQFDGFEITTEEIIRHFTFTREVDINQNEIFNVMSDLENYPNVLPNNILDVRILNHTAPIIGNQFTFAEVDVKEAGVTLTLTIEIIAHPSDKIIIQVHGGDTDGTIITQRFEIISSGTLVTSDVLIRVKGILSPFGFLPQYNFEHALNTIFDEFIDHAKNIS